MPRGKKDANKADVSAKTFNPATMKFREVIESKIRRGKSQQEVYAELKTEYGGHIQGDPEYYHRRDEDKNLILGSEGLRRTDVLDYSRYLRSRYDAAQAIRSSKAKNAPRVAIPYAHTLKDKQYSYTYGITIDGKERFVTVNSDTQLTNTQGKAEAEQIVRYSPKGSGGLGKDAEISTVSLLDVVQKNPNQIAVVNEQNQRTVKYYAKRSKRK